MFLMQVLANRSIETQTRIYKYNKNTTFPVDTLANMPYDYDNERKYVSSTELGTPEAGRNEYTFFEFMMRFVITV